MTMQHSLSILLSLIILTGCSMVDTYEQPKLPVENSYPNHQEKVSITASLTKTSEIGWKEFFKDPYLHQLIEISLQNNRDMKQAVLLIEEAQHQYNIQKNQQLPTITATADFNKIRSSQDLTIPGEPLISKQYNVGLGITAFEIDLFGRIQSLKEAALSQYLATEEAAKTVQITLISEVAKAYFLERSYREQLAVAQKISLAREKELILAEKRFKLKSFSLNDVLTRKGLFESAQVNIAELKRLQAQAKNALTLLLGGPLPPLPKKSSLFLENLMKDIPAGLPSDLLTHRPDIRQAEKILLAAHANIGAARAAFFPKISLTTVLGSTSTGLSNLFQGATRTWGFAPSLAQPIFDWGTNAENLDLAKVRKEISIINYEKSIQIAFQEVSDALAARTFFEQQFKAQKRYTETTTTRTHLVEQGYKKGVNSLVDVLLAEQTLYDTQIALIQLQYQRLTNAITLYKSLGGGLFQTHHK